MSVALRVKKKIGKINCVVPTVWKFSHILFFFLFLKYVHIFPYPFKTVPDCSFELGLLFIILIYSKLNSLKNLTILSVILFWELFSLAAYFLSIFLQNYFLVQCESFRCLQNCWYCLVLRYFTCLRNKTWEFVSPITTVFFHKAFKKSSKGAPMNFLSMWRKALLVWK